MRVKLSEITNYSKGTQVNGDELIENGEYIYLNGGINPSGRWSFFNVSGDTVTISEGGNSSGYVNYISEPFWCGAHCYYLYDGPSNSKYLYYALKSQQNRLFAIRSGACMPNIKKSDLGNFELEFDSDEHKQNEIVKILSNVEQVILSRQKELELFDELIKARFVELFGDPVLNEKGWETRPFLDMGSCKNGMNFRYEDSGVELNCLGVGDFKDNSVIMNTELLPTVSLNEIPSEEYLLRDDDIVFVRSNGNKALVGRSVAVYPGDTLTTFSGFCIRYRKHDDDITIPYLLRVLKTDSIRMKMAGRGANIQNLNQQILGSLIIPVPPLNLQNQFAEFVEQVDKSKVAVQKALDEAQLLFDSLMQEYFG